MDQEQAIDALLRTMSDEEKQHFKKSVLILLSCYGTNATSQGVLIFKDNSEGLTGVTTMNADDMEAAGMVIEANDFFGFLNTIDAPPKEAFN